MSESKLVVRSPFFPAPIRECAPGRWYIPADPKRDGFAVLFIPSRIGVPIIIKEQGIPTIISEQHFEEIRDILVIPVFGFTLKNLL